jgi:hypothetical protein
MTIPATPAALLQISGCYWETCALHAGVMLDVFTPLGGGASTAGGLASLLGCDARALGMLLNALTAMGLLAKAGPNTVSPDSPGSFWTSGLRDTSAT